MARTKFWYHIWYICDQCVDWWVQHFFQFNGLVNLHLSNKSKRIRFLGTGFRFSFWLYFLQVWSPALLGHSSNSLEDVELPLFWSYVRRLFNWFNVIFKPRGICMQLVGWGVAVMVGVICGSKEVGRRFQNSIWYALWNIVVRGVAMPVVNEICCLTSHAMIFQLYMWWHLDVQADWRRSLTYGRLSMP